MYCGIVLWNYYTFVPWFTLFIFFCVLLWNPGGKHAHIVVILRSGICRYFIFHDALGSPSEQHLYGMPYLYVQIQIWYMQGFLGVHWKMTTTFSSFPDNLIRILLSPSRWQSRIQMSLCPFAHMGDG